MRMPTANLGDVAAPSAPAVELFYRHRLSTRLTHWINALCVTILLMSGLQIFNAHPRLYWGKAGAHGSVAAVEIGAYTGSNGLQGIARIGSIEVDTTGVLGVSTGVYGRPTVQAFPSWATIPSYRDLATGRRWHFAFAWLFVLNGLLYFAFSVANGHLRRDLAPTRDELRLRHILRDIIEHARLNFPTGEAAKRYNILQKLSYLGTMFAVLPMIVATGLTMSPGFNALAPWLLDLFGGRQSARTLHFIAAALLLLFVVVHLAMVLLAGPWNEVRSMITGRYAAPPETEA